MTAKRRKEEVGKILYLLDYNKPIVVVEIQIQFIKAFLKPDECFYTKYLSFVRMWSFEIRRVNQLIANYCSTCQMISFVDQSCQC